MGMATRVMWSRFFEVFGNSLDMREVWSPHRPTIYRCGTGTLAMDMTAANLIEKEIMY
jgi:hypothetical protein